MRARYMLPYWPDCELLRAGLQLLRLPHAVCSTAFVFLHRFKRASPSHDLLSSQVCGARSRGPVCMQTKHSH